MNPLKISKTLVLAFFMFYLHGHSSAKVRPSALLNYDRKIDGILRQMTLEEKINMLHAKFMFVSAGVERLEIADMKYADGPFSIREELQPKGWNPLGWEKDKATFFPTGSALAATWSPELAYLYRTGMGRRPVQVGTSGGRLGGRYPTEERNPTEINVAFVTLGALVP